MKDPLTLAKTHHHPVANNLLPKQTSLAEYSKNVPTDEVYETDNVNSIFVCAFSQRYHGHRFTMLERAYCETGHPEQMWKKNEGTKPSQLNEET